MLQKRIFACLAALLLLFPLPALADGAAEAAPGAEDASAEAAFQKERMEALTKQLLTYGNFEDESAARARAEEFPLDPDKPMIALTFDDGPVAGVTDKILDILSKHNAQATFFICGWRIKRAPELLTRTLAEGNELGNHTYNHENLKKLKSKEIYATVKSTNRAIEDVTGVTPKLLRPPGGACGNGPGAAKHLGMIVVLWSQSGNVHLTNPDEIVSTVFRQPVNGRELQSGDIVLLHDTHDYMVEAVEKLVPALQEAGYQLVTVSDLLHYAECGFIPGATYRSQTAGSRMKKG